MFSSFLYGTIYDLLFLAFNDSVALIMFIVDNNLDLGDITKLLR